MQNETKRASDDFISELENSLPKFFDRIAAARSLGGIISAKTLAYSDAQGTGPKQTMKIGRKVFYERTSFLEWLRTKIR